MLIVILIIIIIVIAVINTKRDCEEQYINKPTVIGGNPPNYNDYNTQLTHISNDPSGEPLAFDDKNNFNYTQLYYAFLVQLFWASKITGRARRSLDEVGCLPA